MSQLSVGRIRIWVSVCNLVLQFVRRDEVSILIDLSMESVENFLSSVLHVVSIHGGWEVIEPPFQIVKIESWGGMWLTRAADIPWIRRWSARLLMVGEDVWILSTTPFRRDPSFTLGWGILTFVFSDWCRWCQTDEDSSGCQPQNQCEWQAFLFHPDHLDFSLKQSKDWIHWTSWKSCLYILWTWSN